MNVDVTAAIIDVEYDGSERAVKQLSAMTGLPGWAIRRSREPAHAKEGRRQRWARWQEDVVKAHLGMLTDEEVEELRQQVPNSRALDNLTNLSLPEIAALVGHSPTAVKIRIVRKGWRTWMKNPQWITATGIGHAMNVESHTVVKWIQRGYLKADRMPFTRRLVYRVLRSDLVAFITDPENWAYYDVHRIADPDLRKRALSVRDGGEYVTIGEVARRLGCGVNWIAELIRRGKIPAKRWGNYWIHRDDAERIRLVGPGRGSSSRCRAFTADEDMRIVKARSVGMPYSAVARQLGRITTSVCERWRRIRNDGVYTIAGECGRGILVVDRYVLGSWKAMAEDGDSLTAGMVSRAVERFLLGRPMTSDEMVALQGLFEVWLDFFVDGRQMRRQRAQAKYRVIRDVKRLRGLYASLLSIGLDPCHERWAPRWDAVVSQGRRLTAEDVRNGNIRPILKTADVWKNSG